MQEFSDGESSIVIDERYAPIYFAAWIGAPTEVLARRYCAWTTKIVQRAIDADQPCAVVVDSAEITPPSMRVRAAIAEITEQAPRAPHLVSVYVSAPNPLVRGAITVMRWLAHESWPMTMVSSVEDGAKRAIVFLRDAGASPPDGFDPSRCPRLTR